MVHLTLPGRRARPVVDPLEQLQEGRRHICRVGGMGVRDRLSGERADLLAISGDIGHRQRFLIRQGAAKLQPETALVQEIVLPFHQRPIEPGKSVGDHRIDTRLRLDRIDRHRHRLDEALRHLRPDAGPEDLVAVDLHSRSRADTRGRVRGDQALDVDVRVGGQPPGVEQEKEASALVIGIVQNRDRALLEVLAAPSHLELPRAQVTFLLRPHRLKIDRPHLARGPEAEIARRNPLRQETVLG